MPDEARRSSRDEDDSGHAGNKRLLDSTFVHLLQKLFDEHVSSLNEVKDQLEESKKSITILRRRLRVLGGNDAVADDRTAESSRDASRSRELSRHQSRKGSRGQKNESQSDDRHEVKSEKSDKSDKSDKPETAFSETFSENMLPSVPCRNAMVEMQAQVSALLQDPEAPKSPTGGKSGKTKRHRAPERSATPLATPPTGVSCDKPVSAAKEHDKRSRGANSASAHCPPLDNIVPSRGPSEDHLVSREYEDSDAQKKEMQRKELVSQEPQRVEMKTREFSDIVEQKRDKMFVPPAPCPTLAGAALEDAMKFSQAYGGEAGKASHEGSTPNMELRPKAPLAPVSPDNGSAKHRANGMWPFRNWNRDS